jgi:hypothetical protein
MAADEQVLKAAAVPLTDQGLLDFFRKRTLAEADTKHLKQLIANLGDDSFDVRERASRSLVALGNTAEPLLRQALKNPDVEVVRRAEECLKQIKRGLGAGVPIAAARTLARRKPEAAAETLLGYLPFAEDEAIASEVRAALCNLATHGGKPEPNLVKGLDDANPIRRAAAAEALCNTSIERETILKMLKDPAAIVRLRVAMGLARSGEKQAVPVLIDLLAQLPTDQVLQVDEILLRLAGDKAPDVAPGTTETSRRRCHEVWSKWWKANESQVNLSRLQGPPITLGYTLLLFLDNGEATELDAHNSVRWKISGLEKPLDVQYLAGNRILVAEHDGNRVTERNVRGEIVWQKSVPGPLMAQRLANGHTFIATSDQLLEVDDAGKEVFKHQPGGEQIMKAFKQTGGDIGCVLYGGKFVRLDNTGEEIQSFDVNVRTSGGKIEVDDRGRVLVPEMSDDRVREFDRDGNVVMEIKTEKPIAATRTPNGNVLVTSMTGNKAIEYDRSGKVVWEYKSDKRVNRAFRR